MRFFFKFQTFEELKEQNEIEMALLGFFRLFRVKDGELPRRSTVEFYKSFLKNYIIKEKHLDISDKNVFIKFNRFWKSYAESLKSEGKGDVQHNCEVPDEILSDIYSLLATIHDLMNADPHDPSYETLLEKLPEQIHDSFHYYAQYGAMLVIMHFLARRGREGMAQLKKDDFRIIEDENGDRFYKKVRGELTKNHRTDSENLELGGLIPFTVTPENFSPGLYLKDFIGKLHKNCDFIFQKPARESKKFHIKENPECW